MVAKLANNDFPVVDGIAPSWADVALTLSAPGVEPLKTSDIAAINFGSTVEVGAQKSGGRVVKRTTGEVSHEGSITFYRAGYQKFLRHLKGLAPINGNRRSMSLVHFNAVAQLTPPGSVEIFERRAKGCRMTSAPMALAEGTDADQIEVSLSVVDVVDMIDGEEVSLL